MTLPCQSSNPHASPVEPTRVYSPRDTYSHLTFDLSAVALCGFPPMFTEWHGTGSHFEHETAASKPLCRTCSDNEARALPDPIGEPTYEELVAEETLAELTVDFELDADEIARREAEISLDDLIRDYDEPTVGRD